MEGQGHQEGLQALGVHLEVGLHIHGFLIQCCQFQNSEASVKIIQDLHYYLMLA